MNLKNIVIAACAALALTACATEQTTEKANVLDAEALQAIFKQGGGTCTWTSIMRPPPNRWAKQTALSVAILFRGLGR